MIRPVFLARNFYGDDVKKGKRYHEIALYYLLDVSGTDLISRVDSFTLYEGKHTLSFVWLDTGGLKDGYFYPVFIKKEILNLQSEIKVITEREK